LYNKIEIAEGIIKSTLKESSKFMKFFAKGQKASFTMVEILIDLMIVTLIAMAVLSAFMISMKSISNARARIAAVSIANEKMEIIRNMPYDSLGTVKGWPKGEILDVEELQNNEINFEVKTVIATVDDPYDGCVDKGASGAPSICLQQMDPSKPQDLSPYDYKRAEIKINRKGGSIVLAHLSTYIAANAAETPSDTGILKICVTDSENQPVSSASVSISNTETTPQVEITGLETDNNGCIIVAELPPDSHNHYHLVVTKNGYSTEMTYARTAQNPNATQPDVSIYLQKMTYQHFSIDKLGSIKIKLEDIAGQPISNTLVHIESEKEIYFNPSTKKYSQDIITGENGEITLDLMEYGNYLFTVLARYVVSTSPYQPSYLNPGVEMNLLLTVSDDSNYPVIIDCNPLTGVAGQEVSLLVGGDNFDNNATIKIVSESGVEIVGQNIDVQHSSADSISADFDLSGAELGYWDIIVANPNGDSIKQRDGVEIVAE